MLSSTDSSTRPQPQSKLQRKLCALTLVCCMAPGVIGAQDAANAIRVALYHGQNHEINDDLIADTTLKKKLTTLFGYHKYSLIGKASGSLKAEKEQWLLPSRKFFLNVCPKELHHPASPQISVQPSATKGTFVYSVYHENEPMFQGEYVPKAGVPLIIRGPQYANGVLILVIENSLKKDVERGASQKDKATVRPAQSSLDDAESQN